MLNPRENLRPTEEGFHGLAYDDPVDKDIVRIVRMDQQAESFTDHHRPDG